jgi:hypothetical protein
MSKHLYVSIGRRGTGGWPYLLHLAGCTSQAQFESAFHSNYFKGLESIFSNHTNVYVGVRDLPIETFTHVCLSSLTDYNIEGNAYFDKTYELFDGSNPTSRDAYNAFLTDMGWAVTASPKRQRTEEVEEEEQQPPQQKEAEETHGTETQVNAEQKEEPDVNKGEPHPVVAADTEQTTEVDDIPPSMLRRKTKPAEGGETVETVDLTQSDDA